MSYPKLVIRAALAMVAGLGVATSSWGATASATFSVTTTVPQTCLISTLPVSFGAYNQVGGANNVDASGSVSLTCTKNASVTVDLNGGLNLNGGVRRMHSAAQNDVLNYDLYKASAATPTAACVGGYSALWGTAVASGTTFTPSSAFGATNAQVFNICGRIPSGQDPSPAIDYTDTVTATVTY
jgi:spore coat protein U-like protein